MLHLIYRALAVTRVAVAIQVLLAAWIPTTCRICVAPGNGRRKR
jgi:hypothetical protein